MKRLDCVHDVDRCISSKGKRMENKIKSAFFAILLCACMCVCVCVCVCVFVCVCVHVFACAFISFYRKCFHLSKFMSGANIYVQVSNIMLRTFADLLPQNFPHIRLYLQNSEIPSHSPTKIKIM